LASTYWLPSNNVLQPLGIGGFVKLQENNYTEVMFALANKGPVTVNVDAIPFQSYGT
jgi:hypothetical protein